MDAPQTSAKKPNRSAASPARRDLRRAWIFLVLVPIGFALAMLLGEGAIDVLGYPAGGDKVAPLWITVLVGVPVTLVGILPGLLAVVCGMRARRAGRARGVVPAVIGALVVLYWVFATVAGVAGVSF